MSGSDPNVVQLIFIKIEYFIDTFTTLHFKVSHFCLGKGKEEPYFSFEIMND